LPQAPQAAAMGEWLRAATGRPLATCCRGGKGRGGAGLPPRHEGEDEDAALAPTAAACSLQPEIKKGREGERSWPRRGRGPGARSLPYRGEAGTLPACPAIPGAIVVGPRPPVPRRPRRCPVPWPCRISPPSPASSLPACSHPCLTALVRALCRGC